MSEIDFELNVPLWAVEIYHNTPKSDGLWLRTVQADTQERVKNRALALFQGDNLNPVLITGIIITELKPMGGEDAG